MIGCPLENHPGHKNRDTPQHVAGIKVEDVGTQFWNVIRRRRQKFDLRREFLEGGDGSGDLHCVGETGEYQGFTESTAKFCVSGEFLPKRATGSPFGPQKDNTFVG